MNPEIVTAVLVTAARNGLPADVQELLLYGDASRGVPAGILQKMLATAIGQYGLMTEDIES
jgi:hypothetical protein